MSLKSELLLTGQLIVLLALVVGLSAVFSRSASIRVPVEKKRLMEFSKKFLEK